MTPNHSKQKRVSAPKVKTPSSKVESDKLHRLEVNLLKLKMQNENLQQAKLELEKSRDSYASLYNFAPVGYVTMGGDNRFIEANIAACKMLGLQKDALLKTSFAKFVLPAYRKDFNICLHSMREKNEAGMYELELRSQNGTTFYAEISAEPVQESGGQCRLAIMDITKRKRAEAELQRHRELLEELVRERTRELRDLSHRLVDAQEKERANIGNELHDEIGQLLTYSLLLIDRMAKQPDPQLLKEARNTIQETIGKIRNMSAVLSPQILRAAGLIEALETLVQRYEKSTNIMVDFEHKGRFSAVPEQVALACYRIAQEALTNVARHAEATKVEISLSFSGKRLHLEVADNGKGFTPSLIRKSTGLMGMKERASVLEGELSINTHYGQGTRIVADVPVVKNARIKV